MTAPARILYFNGNTEVALGDRVSIRIWFRQRVGRIVYVPGVSLENSAMDFNGLYRVGIQISDGPFVATNVQPEKGCLKKKIKFLSRDPSNVNELPPERDPFENE